MSKVERKQMRGKIFMVEALDDRVIPVHFRGVAREYGAAIVRAVGPADRRQCERVLAHPIVALDDCITRGDQIAQMHAVPPRIAARLRDVASQGYSILETWRDG